MVKESKEWSNKCLECRSSYVVESSDRERRSSVLEKRPADSLNHCRQVLLRGHIDI